MLEEERTAVAAHARDLADMTPGRTGNLSVRRDERFAATPTGVAYDGFDAGDVPVLDLDGEKLAGTMEPTSEVPMHRHIYRRFEPGAIVHTHGTWATTMAVLHRSLPAVHYMLAPLGGSVPVADYATYGTEELAENVVDALETAGSTACFIANHGLLVTAPDLDTAMEHAVHVEQLSEVYLQAERNGDPVELGEQELERVREKFESYGQ